MKLKLNTNFHPSMFSLLHLCTFFLLSGRCLSDLTELWSIEQLDDMIVSDAYRKGVPASQPAIIGLYETRCKNRLYQDIGFSDRSFPGGLHLQFAAFDRAFAKSSPWYTWHPEIMDVFYRYNLTTQESSNINDWCPIVVYQPANWSLPVEYFDYKELKSQGKNLKEEFKNWVWNVIKIPKMTFENTLKDKHVKILFRYMNPGSNNEMEIVNEQIVATVGPKEKVEVEDLHAGDILVVQTQDDKLCVIHCILTVVSVYPCTIFCFVVLLVMLCIGLYLFIS